MKKYLKSITTALICFLVVIVLNFVLPRALPGDPVAYLSGFDEEAMTTEKYEYYYDALHLNDRVGKQFLFYIDSILDGSLGYSYKQEMKVSDMVFERLINTIKIMIPSLLLSWTVGIVWGLRCGQKKGSFKDKLSIDLNVVINSIPAFVIGLFLMFVLCYRLRILNYKALILPIATLFIAEIPSRFIYIRNLTAGVLDSKYILYARQRGLSEGRIRRMYILPNISGPIISSIGLSVATSVGGSVIVENLFSVNGIGTLLTKAVHSLDYPLLQGILFVCALIMLIAIVLSDLLCILLDPKLRLKAENGGSDE